MFKRISGPMAVAVLAAAAVLLGSASQADAARFFRLQPANGASPSDAPVPVQVATPTTCCPKYCVSYRHHCTLRRTCCGCAAPQKVVLVVNDPCNCGCAVEVNVCLPGCCKGEPSVCSRIGLFRRGIVTYEWCCGYRVKVIFGRCGNVMVHTYGR